MQLLALIFFLVVVIGIISADSRLKKIEGHLRALLDVERESLNQQRENAKALQWLVDRAEGGSRISEVGTTEGLSGRE